LNATVINKERCADQPAQAWTAFASSLGAVLAEHIFSCTLAAQWELRTARGVVSF